MMSIDRSLGSIDERVYMRRALDLAAMARGYTEPNPMVGAVLVAQGRIIGEGYHHRAGQPHAEVMAIEAVKAQDSHLIHGATMYVSLEPCSHEGKTPPCACLLVHRQIGRVVIAMSDPFPLVSGRGIRMLQAAGVEVEVGLMEQEAKMLNEVFLTVQQSGRPFITVKWAESADGFIDKIRSEGSGQGAVRFSSALRERYVHRLRARHGAILVGGRTAMLDNPSLNARYWQDKDPIRIVWSRDEVLNPQLKVFDGSGSTILLCDRKAYTTSMNWIGSSPKVDLLHIPEGEDPLDILLSDLLRRGIHSLLVEGGAMVLQTFLDRGLYDRIEREVSPIILKEGIRAPTIPPKGKSS